MKEGSGGMEERRKFLQKRQCIGRTSKITNLCENGECGYLTLMKDE